jgi:flagellar basal body-associated protein FliL
MKKSPLKFEWNPIHPRRDWKRIIVIFSILVLLVVAWSVYLFMFYQKSEIVNVAPIDRGTTPSVEQINAFFKSR